MNARAHATTVVPVLRPLPVNRARYVYAAVSILARARLVSYIAKAFALRRHYRLESAIILIGRLNPRLSDGGSAGSSFFPHDDSNNNPSGRYLLGLSLCTQPARKVDTPLRGSAPFKCCGLRVIVSSIARRRSSHLAFTSASCRKWMRMVFPPVRAIK